MKILKKLSYNYQNKVNAFCSENNILSNKFVFESYKDIFNFMLNGEDSQKLKILEIGSSGGVSKIIYPNIYTSDIRLSTNLSIICSGEKIPFKDNSLDSIWAKDVVHHLRNFDLFFLEAKRVLRNDGVLNLSEPYWGPIAQIIYRFIHPEDFNVTKVLNGIETTIGNQATIYAILKKKGIHTDIFDKYFEVSETKIVNGLSWILSGGATFTTKFPQVFLSKLKLFESQNRWWMKIFGMNINIRIKLK